VTARAAQRLLVINWDMPPMSGPRAVQVSRTLKHLVPLGWESVVVCFGARSTRYFPDPDLARRLDPGPSVRIVRVASAEERVVCRALWRACPPLKLLPDEKWVWIRSAARAARALAAEERFDAVASFGQPWSDHLIGRRLQRDLKLPWLAHFSDPWTDSPYLRGAAWQRRLWARMERAVVGNADTLVFVNRHTRDRMMQKYPAEWTRKTHVVPHGHDRTMLPPAQPPDADGRLHVVYTGRFYADKRTPDALLRAVHAWRCDNARLPVRITFAGPIDPQAQRLTAELRLEDVVSFTGRMPWAEATSLAMRANLLLVMDAPAEINLFLPSKLIDYLPLRRPILGLTPAIGATADVLGELGYPVVPPDDVGAIRSALTDAAASHRAGSLSVSPQHDRVTMCYDIARTTAAFASALTACMARN
jgi:glycosyltransferase involved in cell wall biosynthesis